MSKLTKQGLFHVLVRYPITGRYNQIPPVRSVFFPVQNRGVERTDLLIGTVYSGRTDRYGIESITLPYISTFIKWWSSIRMSLFLDN